MPRKVRDLIMELKNAGFVDRGIYEMDGKSLPAAMSGRDFVNSIQKIA